jgi:hypothetical protein
MTVIEKALFRDNSAHYVASIDLDGDEIQVILHPWDQPDAKILARFLSAKVQSIDNSYTDAQRDLPWDIIGFDSEPSLNDRWRFCLHTDSVEHCFESKWPTIEKVV